MSDISVIGIIVLAVVAGIVGIAWAKRKGFLINKNIESVLSFVNIDRLVIDILPIAGKYKDKANFVLNVAAETIDYVNTYANGTLSEEDKIVLSLKVIDKICKEYGVIPTTQEKILIEIVVRQGIDFAGKV